MIPTRRGPHPRPAGNRPSTRALASLLVLTLAACGDDDGAKDGAPVPSPAAEAPPAPTAARAYAMAPAELREALDRRRELARRHAGTARGVQHAREAARVARMRALREEDPAPLAEARRLLRKASRDEALEGACEASMELARLEARDAGEPGEAYAVAYRATRRFAAPGGARTDRRECLAEARRMLAVLEPYRPSAERLAAIDADPHGDGRAEAGADAGPDLGDWLARHADAEQGAAATLRRVDVYGTAAGQQGEPTEGGIVRVVLQLDRAARFERGELPAEGPLPRRAYLDFAHTRRAPSVPDSVPVEAAGVQRVRTGRPERGVTRVVFDLEPQARSRLFFLTDPYRVVLDFERGEGAASEGAEPGEAPVVVLDPGHGGDDYGTRHAGLEEAELALDIARRVERILGRHMPSAQVLMTREDDSFISLEQRTAMANAADADAFVSIHLNAHETEVDTGGVATFVLDTSDDEQALRLAARENGTSTEEVTGLQRLLAQLHRRGQVQASRQLAETVHRWTLYGGRKVLEDLPDRGVKEAMFYVLVGARMPAILVEASFLTQPREAEALGTEAYRQALADGIAEGIVRYFQ